MYRRFLTVINLVAAGVGFHTTSPKNHFIAYLQVALAAICYILGDK